MTHHVMEITAPQGQGVCAICMLRDNLFSQISLKTGERIAKKICRECILEGMNLQVKNNRDETGAQIPILIGQAIFRYFTDGVNYNEINCYETRAAYRMERIEQAATMSILDGIVPPKQGS